MKFTLAGLNKTETAMALDSALNGATWVTRKSQYDKRLEKMVKLGYMVRHVWVKGGQCVYEASPSFVGYAVASLINF